MVQKISMRATLVQMKAGESIHIPTRVRGYNSVRNCASLLGVEYPGRKYSVSVDRQANSCKVTRLS